MYQSLHHTHDAKQEKFLTWVTLAEKVAQQIAEWMAQLQHQASTCINTTMFMLMKMMITAIRATTITTDHNMLGIQFTLTIKCAMIY